MDHPLRALIEIVNGREIFYDRSLMEHVIAIPKVVRNFVQDRPEYHQPVPPLRPVLTPRILTYTGTLEEVRKRALEEVDNDVVEIPFRRLKIDEGF